MANKTTNAGITYGLLGGLAMIVITLGLYLGGIEYFLGPIAWCGYIVIIVIAIMAGIRQRKVNGGYLEFGEALKVVFSTFAIAFLLQTLFMYVLTNFIDPPFREALAQATMQKTEEMMKRFGASDSQVEEALKSASSTNNYSLTRILLGYGVMCIIFFIISLIIAAIIKKKKPVFENTFNQ